MDWKRVLAYISGSVDQELQLRNEYLVTENQILRNQPLSEMMYFGAPWRLTTRPRKVRMSTDFGSFLKRAKPITRRE